MRVNLNAMPSAPKEYVVDFPRLDGGLNNWERDYRLRADESPDMKNLWWQGGALCCRDGQIRLSEVLDKTGYSAYERLFHEHGFFHIGDKLYCAKLTDPNAAEGSLQVREILGDVAENRGTWFRCGEKLYYKNVGGYYCIAADGNGGFAAGNVPVYTPIVQINTDPRTGEGEAYQSENRLSGQKTVRYCASAGVTEYHLPESRVDSVDEVSADGEVLRDGQDYTVDATAGMVVFANAPVADTVEITYTKSNDAIYQSVMACPYAVVYGGDQHVCVVIGGGAQQPNAYFWSGSYAVMDPGYFPVEQYNLAGDAQDAITGFGKQQNMLVIFKEHSVGRSSMSAKTANGQVMSVMEYVTINAQIGCDLPGTIKLVENNLVFANTRNGVCVVRDSSSARENNIIPISRKVDNSLLGLLHEADCAASMDDGTRYWLCANGEVYAWDHSLSDVNDPVWFYFDGIDAAAFVTSDAQEHYHLGKDGSVTVFRRVFADYGKGIDKRYRFATQNMGSYDRLKNITGVLLTVRGDTDTEIAIDYTTDHELRRDLTPVRSMSWRLSPRNLNYRVLSINRFATTARRRPGCRHVRHFAMTLSNDRAGMDMSIVSAQIFYNFQGRER